MGKIEVTITPICIDPPKARLPRKLKKDIIRVAGRERYKHVISYMQRVYNQLGYIKFNFKKQ